MTIEELEQIAASVRAENAKFDHEINVCMGTGCLSQHSDKLKDELVKATLVTFDQYEPCSPVPVPMAELSTKPALAMPLLAAPGWAAMACTLALVVKTNGPV